MLAVVTGGSGSGKSEYAEGLALKLEPGRKLYLATMMVWDWEGEERVRRHREMRAGKGFETEEVFTGLAEFSPEGGWMEEGGETVLLECMSNLVCNEFYREEEGTADRIKGGIERLLALCRNVIVVTNEIFSDGRFYGEETERYRAVLGEVNRYLAARAEMVVEVVYGIPVFLKGGERLESAAAGKERQAATAAEKEEKQEPGCR